MGAVAREREEVIYRGASVYWKRDDWGSGKAQLGKSGAEAYVGVLHCGD